MRASFIAATTAILSSTNLPSSIIITHARLADRSRVIKARGAGRRDKNNLAIEGGAYRGRHGSNNNDGDNKVPTAITETKTNQQPNKRKLKKNTQKVAEEKRTSKLRGQSSVEDEQEQAYETPEHFSRRLSSQLTGCCYTYQSYGASDMCALYGEDCESGETPSHDSGDESCEQEGLSFVGISFSVNTASGNPYSYQLCDQFPMENIIDRNYDYVMSMDEDGWLVGGGYKSFDYSGKMPYIDSSHTELLRIGSLDAQKGGTSIETVYEAMNSVSFAPFSIFPEYLKGGGGHHSGDDDGDTQVPSCDITLIVSIVDTYDNDDSYSSYETFLDNLFSAMYAVSGGACMDDHDTDPHVSMNRGVKFKSSWHEQQYMYNANLEVAVWQAMYPKGTAIGSSGYASFPAGSRGNKQYVGYGNLYFFFDRANITKAFRPNRDLSSDESYYSTLYMSSDTSDYYASTTEIGFDYSGSQDGGNDYEHNPYSWKATMAMHDMTDGWDLPPNCEQEGETFFGIPMSRKSDSSMQSSSSFQEQFDFENIIDRNYTYIASFGTNHGWLVGEQIGNGAGSIVDKDTAHIPIFFTGTTNQNMGGMSLANLIKVGKRIDFGTLYIKPAFVFIDDNGHIKLQFEMDPNSALAYLYDNLCKELGIAWNYDTPYNKEGVYTNCAMHASGDRAKYGCGPDGTGIGGFCPQMTVAYSAEFLDEDSAAAYLAQCNNYVDYWRSLYPSGAAVGTSSFCPSGGCLGLFLNRYDLFNVFKPDLGGTWVEYGEGTLAPTISSAPTWEGGCDEPHNFHLDRCFRKRARPKASAVVWDSLGAVGQFTLFLLVFMSVTLAVSIFLARARKRRRKGESYVAFLMRDARRKSKKKKKKRRKVKGNRDLEEAMLDGDDTKSRRSSRSKSRSGRSKSRSRSKSRPKSQAKGEQDEDKSISGRSRSSKRSKSRSKSRTKSRRSSSRKRDGGTSPRGDDNDPSTPRQQLV
mmetsp:Transcript_3825/g.8543  ORF Transcript_3825/g.8543 Transcript_3825/m.8543 type:complete len:975 (-) Transcript_3825:286-3210(-)|eukprot:CAMPEP_0172296978 /NCGR_PEP_ID=MMETSP1058-20130122/157_1 /TAXON_ID=83371 /ORGANISM="Detonula confervacea, Strain CCMP 353" /LENGTH=974 /DNA_ID=CAMNT_0013006067 /DNA_START=141 /DNA_END=3065 /DNA_ORIENTATION=-